MKLSIFSDFEPIDFPLQELLAHIPPNAVSFEVHSFHAPKSWVSRLEEYLGITVTHSYFSIGRKEKPMTTTSRTLAEVIRDPEDEKRFTRIMVGLTAEDPSAVENWHVAWKFCTEVEWYPEIIGCILDNSGHELEHI